MWANYHCHSRFCDGKNTLAEMVHAAQEQTLHSLGFSSHAPLPFDSLWCMKPNALPSYCDEIAGLKKESSLEIYAGLEVDYVPGKISPADFSPGLDYTIGSVHFVESFHDGRGFEIDGAHSLFLEGLNEIFKGDFKALLSRYFALTREMICKAPPIIVGHLDKIKIQNIDNKFFDEQDNWYRHEIDQTLDALAVSGCILEVNTRGLYQKKSATTYPSPWILERARKKNIPVTLSSDAHHFSDLTNRFSETAGLLLQLGFREIHILSEGNWKPTRFDEHGINL